MAIAHVILKGVFKTCDAKRVSNALIRYGFNNRQLNLYMYTTK